MKLRIEIEQGRQVVECSGNPLELLMELSTFFTKQSECLHILKHAIKLSEAAESYINKDNRNLDLNNPDYIEGSKIIDEYMKRYDKGFSKKD